MGWCEALSRFGSFPLADVMEPAIRHASRGFRVTPYLCECVADCAPDMAHDAEIAALYLPGGAPITPGTRLVTGAYADTLRAIAKEGPGLLYGGALGQHYAAHMARSGGHLAMADLTEYRTVTREALRGTYRGFEIVGPPPPSSGPLHIIQMLNILEDYDIGALGFATRGDAASAGRGIEDRLRRPRRRDRRSGVRAGAGGQAAVEVLRRRTARAHRPRPGAEPGAPAWRRASWRTPRT